MITEEENALNELRAWIAFHADATYLDEVVLDSGTSAFWVDATPSVSLFLFHTPDGWLMQDASTAASGAAPYKVLDLDAPPEQIAVNSYVHLHLIAQDRFEDGDLEEAFRANALVFTVSRSLGWHRLVVRAGATLLALALARGHEAAQLNILRGMRSSLEQLDDTSIGELREIDEQIARLSA